MYKEMDENHDGTLTKDEFIEGLKNPKVKVQLNKVSISLEHASEMFDIVDQDQSGAITLDEFVNGCLRGRGTAKSKDLLSVALNVSTISNRLNEIQTENQERHQ